MPELGMAVDPVPVPFMAATRKSYIAPLVNPVTVAVVAVDAL